MIIKKSFIKKTLIKNLINQIKNVKIVVICIPLRLVYLIITQKLSTSVFTSFLSTYAINFHPTDFRSFKATPFAKIFND